MKTKKLIALIMCLAILGGSMTVPAFADGDNPGGDCGANAKWEVQYPADEEGVGVLVISGQGSMDNYDSSGAQPWVEYRNDITRVEVKKGITRIGDSAFADLYNVKVVRFYGDAPAFGKGVFTSVGAKVYVPEGNATWTDAAKQNYGGTMSYDTWTPPSDGPAPHEHSWGPWTDKGDTHSRTCSGCNEIEIAAHSFAVSETAPTCTEDGSVTSVCEDCGKTVTEAIPATGHEYKDTVVAPTETEGGYTLHECVNCGESYKDNFTDPIGPARKMGDVDGDGDVSNTDLITVARYIVQIYGTSKADVEKYGDMDNSGNISNTDLITIARIIVHLD